METLVEAEAALKDLCRGAGMRRDTMLLVIRARAVLDEYNPMTVRQVYYQLVAAHVIENNISQYRRVSSALVKARKIGLIPWGYIEDRARVPRRPSMWSSLSSFIETVREAYRLNVWLDQPAYLEVWVEKDALSGIFEQITREYGITLVVGRGYNSWSALNDAAGRIEEHGRQGRETTIKYFGDFDPSGEDIVRAIEDGLGFFDLCPEIKKVALTPEDIGEYNLPPDFTKASDSRAAAFVAKYGDVAVELDALPVPVLQQKIRDAIETGIDMAALEETREAEAVGVQKINLLLEDI